MQYNYIKVVFYDACEFFMLKGTRSVLDCFLGDDIDDSFFIEVIPTGYFEELPLICDLLVGEASPLT